MPSSVGTMKKYDVTFRAAAGSLGLAFLCFGMASCSSTSEGKTKTVKSKEYFSEAEYGVKASPRVAESNIPKGGGRYMVGKPYQVKGNTYVPRHNPDYDKVGLASWYGSAFHGRMTANGEVYDQYHLSAAHPTMPLPSYARVTNLENGNSVVVRVNDRGPFHRGRIIDLSNQTAELLDMKHSGTAKVRVQYVGPAQMEGNDMPFLMASYVQKGDRGPVVAPGTDQPGIMVASNTPPAVDGTPVATTDATMTATAFSTAAAPAEAVDAFQQFVLLPEKGPQLIERPMDFPVAASGPGTAVSAYVQPVSMSADGTFEAILVRDDRLTADAIKAFATRAGATKN